MRAWQATYSWPFKLLALIVGQRYQLMEEATDGQSVAAQVEALWKQGAGIPGVELNVAPEEYGRRHSAASSHVVDDTSILK